MPLEFKNTFVNPNLQIKGDEIPLEQLEKTSNVIQGRYDTSMDNDTKMQSIAKKLAASANPVDRETANQIMTHYGKAFENRAKSGNYQDMQWQTQQDAQDVAGLYEGLSNRNKQIEKAKADILNSKDYQYSKDKRLKEFNATIKSAAFNKDNGVLQGLEVNPYSTAADVDKQKLALSYGSVMKPISIGEEYGTLKYTDANGQPTDAANSVAAYHVTKGGKETKLTPQQISSAVGQAMLSDESVQAELARDLNYEFTHGDFQGVDPNSPQGQQLKQQYINNNILDKANNAGNLLRIYNKDTQSDITENASAFAGYNHGGGGDPFNPDLHFNAVVSQIDLDKSVEDIRNKQATTSASHFNPDGSFKSSISNTGDNTLQMGKMSQVYGMTNDGKQVKTSFSSLVPDWQTKRIRQQHPGYTDKQVFEDFSNQEANAAKLLLKKYNVSSKEMAGVVDSNTKRLLTTLPFQIEKDGKSEKASEEDVLQALKDGQVSYIPASGQTVINSGGKKLISSLGEQGKSIDANPYQVRMTQMKQMLQAALDPRVNFETSIGKFEMPEPVWNSATGKYENKNTHFRIIKKGEVATDENGKKYYAPEDQIQQVAGGPKGQVVNKYSLDENGLNSFVTHNLSNAVMDFTEK